MAAAAEANVGAARAELCGHALMITRGRIESDKFDDQYRYGMEAANDVDGDPSVRRGRMLLLCAYGQALEQRGDLDESRWRFDEARRLVAELNEPRLLAEVLVASSRTETTAGNFGAAHELLEPALAYFEEHGDLAGMADARSRLAMVFAEQFRVGPALEADIAALRLFDAVGNCSRVAVCGLNVGASYVLCGSWELAERHTRAGLAAFDGLDDHRHDPYIACQLAEIHAGRGERDDAEREFVAGIGAIRHARDDSGLRLKLPEWGRFLVEAGRYTQARVVLDEAIRVWTDIGGEHYVLTAQAILARALAGGDGDAKEAKRLAGDVWDAIARREARNLPFPIEAIADCARVLGDDDPRFVELLRLGRRIVRDVAAELTDATLQANFLDLDDVRYIDRTIT